MNNENKSFSYTYSAKEQAELKKIREKYLTDTKPEKADKMEQLRLLDRSVTNRAAIVAVIVGVIGTLTMGLGMSIIMTEIKDLFNMPVNKIYLIGIAIGVIGIAAVISAYPIYQGIAQHRRKKLAPQILKLTEELMAGN